MRTADLNSRAESAHKMHVSALGRQPVPSPPRSAWQVLVHRRRPRATVHAASVPLLLTLALASMGAACNATSPGGGASSDAGEKASRVEVDIIALGRQLGTIAPCGCTTEPLGGLSYLFGYLREETKPGQRLIAEPGSFLYPDRNGPEFPLDEASWAQADARARLLHDRFSALGSDLVAGLGPADLDSPAGIAALETYPLPRVLSNAASSVAGVETHRVVTLAEGIDAAVLVVVEPSSAPPGFPAVSDPATVLPALIAKLRDHDIILVMAHGSPKLADELAKSLDVDIVVGVGPRVGAERQRTGSPVKKVGSAYVVEPGEQGQTVSHITLNFDPAKLGEARRLIRAVDWQMRTSPAQQASELARLETRLAAMKADPSADPSFVANLESERNSIKDALEHPTAPAAPVEVTFEQIKVTCKRPSDEGAEKALRDYFTWVSEQNVARFRGVKTPEVAAGQPAYAGVDACEACHTEQVEHWKTTHHAGAYQTLVSDAKQFDLSCASCHVTGWRKPSGAELVETRGLENVQCEQCHGPGSLHAEDPDKFDLKSKVPEDVCGECHTPEHSDTFEYNAYLRDVLGAGHGAKAREALGDGPTGHELRAAGFQKAGGACKKSM